jgi:hypothetical protein
VTTHEPSEDLREILRETHGFGHREHVHLAWRLLRKHEDLSQAENSMCAVIREVAELHGTPEKYHETLTVAWTRLVAVHVRDHDEADFGSFIERNEGLLDRSLLSRHFSREVMQSDQARRTFVEPDLIPLPC